MIGKEVKASVPSVSIAVVSTTCQMRELPMAKAATGVEGMVPHNLGEVTPRIKPSFYTVFFRRSEEKWGKDAKREVVVVLFTLQVDE
jgi:hypothetical protein